MVNVGLFVRVEAKAGKEADVRRFLVDALALANRETTTPMWFALQIAPATFAIFDAFEDDAARRAHLEGPIASALMASTSELLATPPHIEMIDVLAAKRPA